MNNFSNRLWLFFSTIVSFKFFYFSATKSNYAHLLTEYVTAQQIGEGKSGPGECFPYYKKCPKSLFKSGRAANKYRLENYKQL